MRVKFDKSHWYKIPILIFIWFWLIINLVRAFDDNINWLNTSVPPLSPGKTELKDSVMISTYLGGWSEFFYFTILTNILVVIVVTASWLFGVKFRRHYKNIIVTYSLVTMIVFWAGIAPFLPWNDQHWFSTYINCHEHLIIFIVMFFWYYTSKERRGKLRYKWLWLLGFPSIYFIANVIMYMSIDGQAAAYPFFNFYHFFGLHVHRWASVLLACASIAVIGGLFSFLFWLVEKTDEKIRGRKHLEEHHEKRS